MADGACSAIFAPLYASHVVIFDGGGLLEKLFVEVETCVYFTEVN